jgi:hypothetical protein
VRGALGRNGAEQFGHGYATGIGRLVTNTDAIAGVGKLHVGVQQSCEEHAQDLLGKRVINSVMMPTGT